MNKEERREIGHVLAANDIARADAKQSLREMISRNKRVTRENGDTARRQCGKKRGYDTQEDADTAVAINSTARKPLRWYHCPICGKYHLTSQQKGATRPDPRHGDPVPIKKYRTYRAQKKQKMKHVDIRTKELSRTWAREACEEACAYGVRVKA
jgi:hypothetical protein